MESNLCDSIAEWLQRNIQFHTDEQMHLGGFMRAAEFDICVHQTDCLWKLFFLNRSCTRETKS